MFLFPFYVPSLKLKFLTFNSSVLEPLKNSSIFSFSTFSSKLRGTHRTALQMKQTSKGREWNGTSDWRKKKEQKVILWWRGEDGSRGVIRKRRKTSFWCRIWGRVKGSVSIKKKREESQSQRTKSNLNNLFSSWVEIQLPWKSFLQTILLETNSYSSRWTKKKTTRQMEKQWSSTTTLVF